MPRLQYNPNLEPPVNAADEAFLNLVRARAPEGQEAEVAAQFALLLEDAHRQRVDAWEAQQAADREVMEEEEAIRVANEAARREEARKEAEAELKERDKKRPKLADIGRDTMIDSSLRPPVPAYAVEKLAKFDYVPLWYFTNEAREELRNMLQSTSDDTYQLANGDEGVVLRSAHAAAHAKKVIPDSNLTWNQMSRAFPDLLSKMEDLRWPQQHVDSLARFFTKLVMHPYLNKTNGEAILLRYQARARLDWHETIRRPHKEGEKVYDISYISVALLRTIEHDIAIEISNLRSEEVCPPSFIERFTQSDAASLPLTRAFFLSFIFASRTAPCIAPRIASHPHHFASGNASRAPLVVERGDSTLEGRGCSQWKGTRAKRG